MHNADTNPIVGVSYVSSGQFRNRIEVLFALESQTFYALLVTTREALRSWPIVVGACEVRSFASIEWSVVGSKADLGAPNQA